MSAARAVASQAPEGDAASARGSRIRDPRARYYKHPAMIICADGTEKPCPSNYPIPRKAWLSQHVQTSIELRVSGALFDAGKSIAGRVDRLVRLSFAEIRQLVNAKGKGRELGDDAIKRAISGLEAKRAIVQWDPIADQPMKRQRGGAVRTWLVRSYDEHLQALRDDPKVGRVGNTFFVHGKGRRLMTPAELQLWGITDAQGKIRPESEAALARAGSAALPLGVQARTAPSMRQTASDGQQRTAKPEPVARAGPAPPGSRPRQIRPAQQLPFTGDQLSAIAAAMRDKAQCPATPDDALFMLRKADENPAARVAEVPAAVLCDLVARVGAGFRMHGRSDAEYQPVQVAQKLPKYIDEWRARQVKHERQQARGEQWKRDAEINAVATALDVLDNPESGPNEIEAAQSVRDAAAPEIVDAATRLRQEKQNRTAGATAL